MRINIRIGMGNIGHTFPEHNSSIFIMIPYPPRHLSTFFLIAPAPCSGSPHPTIFFIARFPSQAHDFPSTPPCSANSSFAPPVA